jgi:hypothetical protein
MRSDTVYITRLQLLLGEKDELHLTEGKVGFITYIFIW